MFSCHTHAKLTLSKIFKRNENFFIENNFHTVIKTFIFKQIYLKEEKTEINNILKEVEEKDAEYKYIEIVSSNKNALHYFFNYLIQQPYHK